MSTDYSALDKLLHRLVLGMPMIGEMLADLDGATAGPLPKPRAPVFVTGLARAGTTTLMRGLHETGQFASLTYADMPMVMAPNLWARLSRGSQKDRVAKERAHGDGIAVDFDAPEALEEVFWRTHCGRDYITADGLVPHVPGADVLADFRAYHARVCKRYGAPRYLAKNNNMMLRLLPVVKAMPDARVLVLVRDPVAQAVSLQAQHRRFADADAFTRSYMTWLVHHEFGPDQRPFRLPGQPVPEGDPDRIDYWLTEWIACYGWLQTALAERPDALRPVIYEALTTDPAIWAGIAAFTGLPPDTPAPAFRAPSPCPVPPEADPGLVARARALYAALAGPGTPAA